jgi:hypothetical protein
VPVNQPNTVRTSGSPRRSRINIEKLEPEAAWFADQFRAGDPFPHVVIDDFVSLDPGELAQFPSLEWQGWVRSSESYQRGKASCNDPSIIPLPFVDLIDELSQPRFLRFLERVTGIDALVPDPYLIGGGLHVSGPGGILARHTDFHYHPTLNLFRRLYLNPGWSKEDGGELVLTDRTSEHEITVVPDLGRCVIFATSDRSLHGVPTPVAEGRVRRSIALYYYTAQDSAEFGGLPTTDWQDHGAAPSHNRFRFNLSRGLLNIAKAFTLASHVANPNQGGGTAAEALREYRRRHFLRHRH